MQLPSHNQPEVHDIKSKDAHIVFSMGKNSNNENLEIDIPKAQGLAGRQLGVVKWTINGKIVVTTDTYDAGGSA